MTGLVLHEDHARVRLLTLNRPDVLNSFDQQMYDALTDALLAADGDDDVSVLLLTGGGRAFSAGTDLTDLAEHGDFRRGPDTRHGFNGLLDILVRLRKPFLCAVNGMAVGLGATLLGHADLVFMAQTARVRCPFTALGLAPEAGSSSTFTRLLGRQHASWALLSSAWLDAEECLRNGLAFKVVEPELLLKVAMEHARELARHPLDSLIATKRLIASDLNGPTRLALDRESVEFDALLSSSAHQQALRAFHGSRSTYATAATNVRTSHLIKGSVMSNDPGSSTATDRVQQLLADYSSPSACVADLLCDRHPAEATAYTLVEPDLTRRVLTYGELRASSERFAQLLTDLGVQPGDRVATLLGKTAEHLIAVLGTWRAGAVHVPLFTAFAPAAIAARLAGSATKVVVCDETQRPKLAPGDDLPADVLWRIITTGAPASPQDLSFAGELSTREPGFRAVAGGGDAPLIHLYTSGTTGTPKSVVVPVKGLASFHAYMEFGLDLRPDDVFWNAADPGWGYGHYFGITGSLCTGVPSVWLNSGFDPGLTWRVMAELGVTNFTAAPTVYRSLRAGGPPPPGTLRLRCLSAAGEPLTPEINTWAQSTFGLQVADHYGQTETGMLINNHHNPSIQQPLKPGSMGQAMPGWTGVVLHEDRDEPAPAGSMGRIALDLTASPLAWFSGYLNEPDRSKEKFSDDGRWYLTGDAGSLDGDGYFRFQSRDDDVIIMAGYRIGPFDVESVLLTHPAVNEAAVIAAPDELRGEVLEAFVVLRDETACTPALVVELQQLVKTKFAAHAYPRAIHAVNELPKTPSGKVQRYVLRQRRQADLVVCRAIR